MDDGDAYNACVCGATQQQSRQPNKMWEKGGETHEPGREQGMRECKGETKAPKQRKRATHLQKAHRPWSQSHGCPVWRWVAEKCKRERVWWEPLLVCGVVGEASVLMCGSGSSWVGQGGEEVGGVGECPIACAGGRAEVGVESRRGGEEHIFPSRPFG